MFINFLIYDFWVLCRTLEDFFFLHQDYKNNSPPVFWTCMFIFCNVYIFYILVVFTFV